MLELDFNALAHTQPRDIITYNIYTHHMVVFVGFIRIMFANANPYQPRSMQCNLLVSRLNVGKSCTKQVMEVRTDCGRIIGKKFLRLVNEVC